MDIQRRSITFYFVTIIISSFLFINAGAFINPYPKLKSFPLRVGEDAGNPLFLTPLIENGKIDEARKQASVQHKEMLDIGSYAGYLTVNKKYNSNMFFWFFPAQVNNNNQIDLYFL